MKKYGVKYRIGSVAEAGSNKQLTPAKLAANDTAADSTSHEAFGDLIPYADPSWYQGYHSPYYNETHVALRQEIREWVEEYVTPNIEDWEEERQD